MSTGTNEQMITGGELVAKALKAEGVEVIYTYAEDTLLTFIMDV